MKRIKIKFVSTAGDERENIFTRILKRRYDVVLSDDPEYVFSSVYDNQILNYNCIRICFTGEAVTPNLNFFDYVMGFDKGLTYDDRCFYLPIYKPAIWGDSRKRDFVLKRELLTKNDLSKKDLFCTMVLSNGFGSEMRAKVFQAVNSYKPVSSGGGMYNNIGGRVKDKIAFQLRSKFVIACENGEFPGYCTEKMADAYASDAIPIYWGSPLVAEEFNENSFIDVRKFATPEDLVAEIKAIDEDDDRWLAMMHEKPFKPSSLTTAETIQSWEDETAEFLYHIFDQDYAQAFRRNRSYWGEKIAIKQRRQDKLYALIDNKVGHFVSGRAHIMADRLRGKKY